MSLKGKQELHYLGIPVNINYRFARVGIVTFYASAGGKADFNIRGSHKDLSRSEQFEGEDFEKFTDNKTQLSVHFKLGASLTFTRCSPFMRNPQWDIILTTVARSRISGKKNRLISELM